MELIGAVAPFLICGAMVVVCMLLMRRHHTNRGAAPEAAGDPADRVEIDRLRLELAELRADAERRAVREPGAG